MGTNRLRARPALALTESTPHEGTAIPPIPVQVVSRVARGKHADLLENIVPFVGYFQIASLIATLIITVALLSKANEHMHVLTASWWPC